jgi:hypothetical protein
MFTANFITFFGKALQEIKLGISVPDIVFLPASIIGYAILSFVRRLISP